jgi:chaperone required for assembly of F1-ATPase
MIPTGEPASVRAASVKAQFGTFKTVDVVPGEGRHRVRIDGKPLKTPRGEIFALPNARLAEAIADEWRASAPRPPKPDAMPLTRVAGTVLDRLTQHRAIIERQLLAYAETELLCHRADAPEGLVQRQHAIWQPLLDWVAIRHDAMLTVTTGIVAVAQPERSLAALRGALAAMDPWRLAAISVAVAASGSLVIGLALSDGRIDPQAAFEACELDATWQIERWGEDKEASDRRAVVRADLELAKRFLDLLDV